MLARDFPEESWGLDRRAVCRRCHLIMSDAEPMFLHGEFHHLGSRHQTRARSCVNAGKTFRTSDPEIEPFLKKGRRRYLKRAGIHH